jgi:hypothetical protein
MTRWNQGRATIDALITQGEIEHVPASQQSAEAELERSRTHLTSARQLLTTDPEGPYTLAYDAARRALAAVPQNQGLRATSRGGHGRSTTPCSPNSTLRSDRSCAPSTACAPAATRSSTAPPRHQPSPPTRSRQTCPRSKHSSISPRKPSPPCPVTDLLLLLVDLVTRQRCCSGPSP